MPYKIIKETCERDGNWECEHPLCDTLHKRWHQRYGLSFRCVKPLGGRVTWSIVDVETNKVLSVHGETHFDLKRDAVSALEYLTAE